MLLLLLLLFPKLQSGYRKSHSTETALLRVQNNLLRSIDTGNEALVIVLDFSAAFDTIDHDFLFCLFHQRFGLTDTIFDWIVSFFHHRRYFVSTGKYSSNPHLLQFGVPQGSVLGPLLLSLYFTTRTDLCCPRLEGYAVRWRHTTVRGQHLTNWYSMKVYAHYWLLSCGSCTGYQSKLGLDTRLYFWLISHWRDSLHITYIKIATVILRT